MGKRFAGRTGHNDVRYRIVIRGEICEPLVGPLEGMSVEVAGEESVLTVDLVDQAQLRGALSWLNDLGIEIVSVNPVDEEAGRVMAGGPT
jgi:hypothetical protein